MPIYSFEEAPAEVRELLARSCNEERDPKEVRKELTRLGVNPTLQMMYLRDGMGLSLEQAKRIVIGEDEPNDGWVEAASRAVSEVVTDDTARPRTNKENRQ
jgi:hypothetical protein